MYIARRRRRKPWGCGKFIIGVDMDMEVCIAYWLPPVINSSKINPVFDHFRFPVPNRDMSRD